MENAWIEWKGYGDLPVGKVTVKFRDNEIVEDEDASYLAWGWVTGDRPSEIIAYKVLTDKKTKTERERPEFTFEDGVTLFRFSLKHCTPYSKMLVQLDKRFVDDLIVVLTEEPTGEEQTRFAISEIDKFLRVTRVFQQSYKNKEFRKKLKLYVKWLQSKMSEQGE